MKKLGRSCLELQAGWPTPEPRSELGNFVTILVKKQEEVVRNYGHDSHPLSQDLKSGTS